MKLATSALIAGLCFLAPTPGTAQARVSRCTSADGVSLYTDGSCRAVGAQPVPMSAELMRNLIRARRAGGTDDEPDVTPRSGPGQSRRPRADACPRTPAQLAAALRASLGAGDINQLASLYDWTGKTGRQARPILERLEQMSGRRLIDGRYFDNFQSTGAASSAVADGFVQLVQGPEVAPSITELAVNRRAGCLFLNF